jgi:amidase
LSDLWQQSARELASSIRSKTIGSRELLDLYLHRIDRLDASLNAVVTLDADTAFRAASKADDAVVRGERIGALHGLPVTVKDALETAGMRSTGGAAELRDNVPERDAPAVARIKSAGAIVFGKTNVPKWSADSQTYNELFGATRNPWDTSLSPGGSSGGPAVAVACGFTAFETGTDIGGSIRMPAHFTGVCGHKPSFGIVPSRGYLDHAGGGLAEPDMNVIGPLARDVRDLELLLDVLAGADEDQAGAWQLRLPSARTGARLGVWLDEPSCRVDKEVLAVLEEAVAALEADGAEIDADARPVDFDESTRVFLALLSSAVSPGLSDEVFERAKELEAVPRESGEDLLLEMGRGTIMRHRDWIAVNERRELIRRRWSAWFADHDALLCPVTPVAAQPMSDESLFSRTITVDGASRPANDLVLWPGLAGVACLPSTVVPVGRTASGLPVGVQVVGPYLGDRTSLKIAQRLGDLTGGYEAPPMARLIR